VSEATEFLVFCSALRDTARRLRRVVGAELPPAALQVVERMAGNEVLALARLQALLEGNRVLPEEVTPPSVGRSCPLDRFLECRLKLLELLDGVNGPILHREGRLPSGRFLDPWRLAGHLADHDVQCLAKLRGLLSRRL
jgi:hypothetical protein